MEETKKKSKKKLWIALGSLAIAVIAGLSVTVGVLAANQANISGSINVIYTVSEVAANVSGRYQVLNTSAVDFTTGSSDDAGTDWDESKVIHLDGTEATASGTFQAVNIVLTSTNKSVTFTYTIANLTDAAMQAQLTLPSTTNTNMTVSAGTAYNDTASAALDVTAGTNHATDTFTIPANATATYSLTVTITNVANSAAYAGSFVWNLTLA